MPAPGFDRTELPPAALTLAADALTAAGLPTPRASAAIALGALGSAGWKLVPPTAEEAAAIEAHDAALLESIEEFKP